MSVLPLLCDSQNKLNTKAMFGNVLQWKIRTCFKSTKTGTALDLQITSNGLMALPC